ncbi:uncharacterized protein [Leptinotarsa decemlineata]|uniref:uncharacterized protein n=1 Tax=Leptinotarsa decemlineata TaxID=7539 RepID=UPI003D306E64
MKVAQFFIIVSAFYASSFAWEATILYDPSTHQSSHCFSDKNEIGTMDKGEQKTLANECVLAKCLNNRNIRLVGCGSQLAEPPCKIVDGDLSKPHPDCCPQIECS